MNADITGAPSAAAEVATAATIENADQPPADKPSGRSGGPGGAGSRYERSWRFRARRFAHRHARTKLTSLLLLPICVIWIYPFLWMVSAAFKPNSEIFAGLGLIPNDVALENFSRAWEEANIGVYFFNTVVMTVGSIVIVLVSTAMMGYVLGRYSFPGKTLIIVFYVATVFLPEGYTIIPVFQLINSLGLADTLWGLILGSSGGAHVVMVLLFAGFFNQLPKALEESATIDGAGFIRVFWTIMLPLAKPVIATVIILQFMHAWNAYLLPLVITLTRPDLRTLAVGLRAFQGEFSTDWAGMAAAATISLMPIIITFLFLQRYFVEAVAGAVKQ